MTADATQNPGGRVPEFETSDARKLSRNGGEEHGAIPLRGDLDWLIPLLLNNCNPLSHTSDRSRALSQSLSKSFTAVAPAAPLSQNSAKIDHTFITYDDSTTLKIYKHQKKGSKGKKWVFFFQTSDGFRIL